MSLKRPAAGGESCFAGFFVLLGTNRKILRISPVLLEIFKKISVESLWKV